MSAPRLHSSRPLLHCRVNMYGYTCTYCVPSRAQTHNNLANGRFWFRYVYHLGVTVRHRVSDVNYQFKWRCRLSFKKLFTFTHAQRYSQGIVSNRLSRIMWCANDSEPSLYKKKYKIKNTLPSFTSSDWSKTQMHMYVPFRRPRNDCQWMANLFSQLFFSFPSFSTPARLTWLPPHSIDLSTTFWLNQTGFVNKVFAFYYYTNTG